MYVLGKDCTVCGVIQYIVIAIVLRIRPLLRKLVAAKCKHFTKLRPISHKPLFSPVYHKDNVASCCRYELAPTKSCCFKVVFLFFFYSLRRKTLWKCIFLWEPCELWKLWLHLCWKMCFISQISCKVWPRCS